MSTGIFSIGISGINAAQLGLLTTEHNVVNANTPGYTRQRTVQATNIAVNSGAGSIGQGVHVETIERVYDAFMNRQVNTAQTKVSELGAFYSQIKQIDNMLADASAGLSPALQDFFSGVQQVAANPSLLPARQAMISSAQTMVERFQTMDSRLEEINYEINGRISNAVAEINNYASLIAEVNQRIVVSEASYGQPANDLLDQRDRLVSELNQLIKVSTTTNSDGSFNVFIGSGQQLVVGGTSQRMTASPSIADASRIAVGLETNSGSLELPEYLINGGVLGGLVSFRSGSLDRVTNDIGRLAASLTLTFNAQLALGQDLLGNVAGDPEFVGNLFTMSGPRVQPNSANTGGGNLAVAFAPPEAPGAPSFSGNFYTELQASDYQVSFSAGGAYSVTRLSDNTVVSAGTGAGVASFDGLNLTITTVGAPGDRFKIEPFSEIARNIGINQQIAADPRLIAAAAPVRVTPNVANTGTFRISQGIVGGGYVLPSSAQTLTVNQTLLQGVPSAWTAVYSDGRSVPGAAGADIPLTDTGAKLVGFTFDNMHFTVSGAPPATGSDRFVVDGNTTGIQDGRNAILFAKLQTQNTMDGGASTYQAAYAKLVADNGIRSREAKVQLDAQTAVLQQAQANREALSGVNLDEEAANMLKFQRAYQASSKLLEIGNKLFDTILSLG